jgi:hypothetical protein
MKENKPRPSHSSSHNSSNYDRNSRDDSRRDNHRHSRRDHDGRGYDSRPKSSRFSFFLGQFFGLVYNLAVLYVVYDLVQQDRQELALNVFAINAGVMIFAILISFVERKFFRKNHDRRFKRR